MAVDAQLTHLDGGPFPNLASPSLDIEVGEMLKLPRS
jgi:hypothetical protein